MEWSTIVADFKIQEDIRSLMNNFIEDFTSFKINDMWSFELVFCKYFFIVACYSVYMYCESQYLILVMHEVDNAYSILMT